MNLTGSYTRSKFLGNTNDTANPDAGRLGQNNGPYSDYYNRRADYGPLESDVENRFLISAVCELPFGKGHHWLRGGLPGLLAGGWTIGALASLQSGVPLTAVTVLDTTNAFLAGSQRTNVARDPNLPSTRRSVTRWFDIAALSQPAAFTFGDEGLGIIRSGGWANADFSLLRNFARDRACPPSVSWRILQRAQSHGAGPARCHLWHTNIWRSSVSAHRRDKSRQEHG